MAVTVSPERTRGKPQNLAPVRAPWSGRAMRYSSLTWRKLGALALVLGACGATARVAGADTPRPRVKLGEVSASAPADARLLRASFEEALRAETLPQATPGKLGARAIVSVSVLSCDERACAVSAVLRDETKGTLLAILRGSARSAAPTAHEALLKGAAVGAARQIPRALP